MLRRHNGTLAADHAADVLHTILAAEPALRTCTGEGPPAALAREEQRMGAALTHAFEATDRQILQRCRAEGVKGGATGVAVLRCGDQLYAAHCGDSRAVMCRRGEALRLTEDHKPNVPRERKRVEALGGRVSLLPRHCRMPSPAQPSPAQPSPAQPSTAADPQCSVRRRGASAGHAAAVATLPPPL
jgi:serine/threonine protein phosphatase PrpC